MSSTSFCRLCLHYKGAANVLHGPEGCPIGASTLCRRCHHRGHLSVDCTAAFPHWERPTTLEELIPLDVRMRLKINTHTEIKYTTPREESELPDINTISIPDGFKELSEFADEHGITVKKVTKPSKEDLLRAIKKWGVAHGYRIIQIAKIHTISKGLVDGKEAVEAH